MIHLIAATTQPTWDQGVINIVTAVWTLIGGTAGVIAILLALKNSTRIGKAEDKAGTALVVSTTQGAALQQQHEKINELAEKNPADVKPLPPCPTGAVIPLPVDTTVTPPTEPPPLRVQT